MPIDRDDQGQAAQRIGVLQVVDSLALGGAERVAVNLANLLPRERFDVHLCLTRQEGPLSSELSQDVPRLLLARRSRLDEPRAVARWVQYVRRHRIRIIHCHKDTIFLAALAAALLPKTLLLWHDHYGEYAFQPRPTWLYRLANWRTSGIISVNEPLLDWAVKELGFPPSRVWYVANFVLEHSPGEPDSPLPGEAGSRIVCVANVRLQKDQINLVRAMTHVVRELPQAHVLMVGEEVGDYAQQVRHEITTRGLQDNVSILGQRMDVQAILAVCDVGVLSSESEGLPLSLIEYGMAGLPSVATRVGQCPDVLGDGAAGLLVPPKEPEALARGLLHLLSSPERRNQMGKIFRRHAELHYGQRTGIRKVCEVYDTLLASG